MRGRPSRQRISLSSRDVLGRIRELDRENVPAAAEEEELPEEPIKLPILRCGGWVPHPYRPIKVGCDAPVVGEVRWLDEQIGYCWEHAEEITRASGATLRTVTWS